jgi:hypothetical protein
LVDSLACDMYSRLDYLLCLAYVLDACTEVF